MTAVAVAEVMKERLQGVQLAVDVADDVQWGVGQGLLHGCPRLSLNSICHDWQSNDDAFRPRLPLLRPAINGFLAQPGADVGKHTADGNGVSHGMEAAADAEALLRKEDVGQHAQKWSHKHQEGRCTDCALQPENQEQGWPDQVELLFHGQRPDVSQLPAAVEVVVGGVGGGMEYIAGAQRNPAHGIGKDNAQHQKIHRGEDTEGPPQVEASEDIEPVWLYSASRSVVIRKPEITKKMRTPSSPRASRPGSIGGPPTVPVAWESMTSIMDRALIPSRQGMRDTRWRSFSIGSFRY